MKPMLIFRHLPNALTCMNLLCGYTGTIFALQGNLELASKLIFVAAFLDFCDGFAARLLKAHSSIGKDLDSLADVVTFGLLPGIILYKLVNLYLDENQFLWLSILTGMVPVFSALRLAKFNVDTRQTNSFLGLPTPANAIFVASIPFICSSGILCYSPDEQLILLFIMAGTLMSLLLVTEIPLMALKFKSFQWRDNQIKYILIIVSVVLIGLLKIQAIPFILLLYIALSILDNRVKIAKTLT